MTGGKHASYFDAIFGITLVLFVLGLTAVLVMEIRKVSTGFKETLAVELVLNDSLGLDKASAIQKTLQVSPYLKNIRFISKDEAARTLQKDLGENFLDILGYNPLYPSFILNLREDYANKDSFGFIKTNLAKIPGVNRVNIQNNILESLDVYVKRVSLVILVVVAALLIFAVSLIFNTIRLAMFSNRFTIKTMQLIGATRWFIIRPFLAKSILNGLVSGVVACLLMGGLTYYFDYCYPELGLKADLITFALLFGAVILFGILISFFSTLTAVLRYLRLKVEDLY